MTEAVADAPPEPHKRSDEKSNFSRPGTLRMATCIVGTPM